MIVQNKKQLQEIIESHINSEMVLIPTLCDKNLHPIQNELSLLYVKWLSTNEETIIKKERVHVEDFKQIKDTPFDIRFAVCKEIPMEHDYESEMDGKKTKTRTSYIRKNVSIDMTSISGNTQDMDSEDPFTYQIEFEIIKPQNVEDKDTLFNIIHKIKDLFIMLE